ncbi:MAG: hypothetical protein AAFN30_00610, partial [Actinomycetota bacterium]
PQALAAVSRLLFQYRPEQSGGRTGSLQSTGTWPTARWLADRPGLGETPARRADALPATDRPTEPVR